MAHLFAVGQPVKNISSKMTDSLAMNYHCQFSECQNISSTVNVHSF